MTADEAQQLLSRSTILISATEIEVAIATIAQSIQHRLADADPLVLSIMGGSVIFTGKLLPQLNFPLDFDYLHVSRYGNNQSGSTLTWHLEPRASVIGRTVLLLDDILDEGITLFAVREALMQKGAKKVLTAVLANKIIAIEKNFQKPIKADFVGIDVPDRFVFGCGMDVEGRWRNLPAIYAEAV